MKKIILLVLVLPLSACAMFDSSPETPAPQMMSRNGDCTTVAAEHRREAAFANLDEATQQETYANAYKDCEAWKSGHAWAQQRQQ